MGTSLYLYVHMPEHEVDYREKLVCFKALYFYLFHTKEPREQAIFRQLTCIKKKIPTEYVLPKKQMTCLEY